MLVSQIFPRLKPSGTVRIMLNLKPLNEFVEYKHFKMEHLSLALGVTRRDLFSFY